jgi:histidine triad (HIT) family protein
MPDANADCLFCKIVSGEVASTRVAESDLSVAFRDLDPQAPTHVLVIPRRHASTIADLAQEDPASTADLFSLAGRVADDEGILQGYRLVTNTGPGAGQTVFHVHVHVLGGRPLTWPPG